MKTTNIKDIARLAGVGVSTVSRVINGHPDVKDETREAVHAVIEKYNYIPNNSARNLKRTESSNIGILIKGLYNPFFAKMIQTIEKTLAKEGFSVIIHYNTEEHRDIDAAYEFVVEKRLRGIICLGGDFDQVTDVDIERLDIPIVFTSTEVPSGASTALFSSVIIDNEKAAYRATEYLYEIGHRHIGLLTSGGEDRSVGTYRTNGYLKLLGNKGIPKQEHYFEWGSYTFESGYEATKRLLEKAPDLTAIVVISDVMAIGAAKAAKEFGREIPETLSIIGFDDIDYAAYYNPPLTTIRQPVEEIASASAEILLNVIQGEATHQHMVYETQLVQRASCAELL
ncbi:LacI family DNA-binding transcriptional regulator [Fusibacter tunisiensis]|uniref:LacI family transcriptional regulator n=1 Tax=Fusibacter tunisiensis TaxID=1008308 RepID=A0ABS2MQS1_9FIRM|nr:LacI family DNA-binding transcriptional regulator [Fusibacter tunisiensis]MBM7561757.1 LacI family transcriptional regulator [Fusibacter tunisiensis]